MNFRRIQFITLMLIVLMLPKLSTAQSFIYDDESGLIYISAISIAAAKLDVSNIRPSRDKNRIYLLDESGNRVLIEDKESIVKTIIGSGQDK